MEFPKIPKSEIQEDDEESLSLIDLPLNINLTKPKTEAPEEKINSDDFNFDICLYNCSVSNEDEMCVADDVFFQGQMLPYRHSVSSDTGISLNPTRYILRSESMDHPLTRGVISSSRSSSINSQYSSSSGSLTGSLTRNRNNFHSHPSPSPRIQTGTRYGNPSSNFSRRFNLWEFCRVGLVKTPEIELRDFGNRSQNSTTSSKASSRNRGNKIGDGKMKNIEKKKKNGILDFGGCKSSVNVISPVNCEAKKTTEKHRKMMSWRYRTSEWINELSV